MDAVLQASAPVLTLNPPPRTNTHARTHALARSVGVYKKILSEDMGIAHGEKRGALTEEGAQRTGAKEGSVGLQREPTTGTVRDQGSKPMLRSRSVLHKQQGTNTSWPEYLQNPVSRLHCLSAQGEVAGRGGVLAKQ